MLVDELGNLDVLEKRERLMWAFRFRRRLIIGLLAVYALAVTGGLVRPLWGILVFFLFFLGVNELREWRFHHGKIDDRISKPTVMLEIFAVAIILYFSGGYESVLLGLAVLQVVGVSTFVGFRLGWVCAYSSTTLFTLVNMAELFGLLPHSPLLLRSSDGGFVPLMQTPLGQHGTGHAFMFLAVACVAYGVMLSLAAYSSGYILSKLKVREAMLSRANRLHAALAKLSGALLGELSLERASEILVEWVVTDLGYPRAAITVEACGQPVHSRQFPAAAIDEEELARLTGMRHPSGELAYFAGWIGAPLVCRETRCGWLLIETKEEPSAADSDTLDTALNQFRTCLEKVTVHADAVALSVLDGMTGIHNHRHLVTALKGEVSRARRYQQPLALLLVDVDHFKKVNDTHGHLAGDAVLKGLAARLKETVRNIDIVARYGGEEFVVVAPQTDINQASAFADRIRRRICEDTFPSDGKTLAVSVSIGVSETLSDHAESEDDLLRIADTRLYRAKEGGRNRVVAA